MKAAELKVLPVADLKPAEYNPRKKLKPGDKEYEKIKVLSGILNGALFIRLFLVA